MFNQFNIESLGLSSEHFIVKEFYLDKEQNKYIAIIESKKKNINVNVDLVIIPFIHIVLKK